MPVLVIILVAYYAISSFAEVIMGPRSVYLSPLGQVIRVAIGVGVVIAWLSLPIAGGVIPIGIYIIAAWGSLATIIVVFQTGKTIDITSGNIALSVILCAIWIVVLSTLTYA